MVGLLTQKIEDGGAKRGTKRVDEMRMRALSYMKYEVGRDGGRGKRCEEAKGAPACAWVRAGPPIQHLSVASPACAPHTSQRGDVTKAGKWREASSLPLPSILLLSSTRLLPSTTVSTTTHMHTCSRSHTRERARAQARTSHTKRGIGWRKTGLDWMGKEGLQGFTVGTGGSSRALTWDNNAAPS